MSDRRYDSLLINGLFHGGNKSLVPPNCQRWISTLFCFCLAPDCIGLSADRKLLYYGSWNGRSISFSCYWIRHLLVSDNNFFLKKKVSPIDLHKSKADPSKLWGRPYVVEEGHQPQIDCPRTFSQPHIYNHSELPLLFTACFKPCSQVETSTIY